jgi:hypothetical protein
VVWNTLFDGDLRVWKWLYDNRELLNYLPKIALEAAVAYYMTKALDRWLKDRDGRRLVTELWNVHFEQLLKQDSQGTIGCLGGLSDYDIRTAKHLYFNLRGTITKAYENVTFGDTDRMTSPDKSKNLIIVGGWVPCRLTERILRDENLPYYGALKIDGQAVYRVPQDYIRLARNARKKAYAHGNQPDLRRNVHTFIADRIKHKPLLEADRNDDGTLASTGVIVTYKESYWTPSKMILSVDGIGGIGTYLSNELLFNPKYTREFVKELDDRGVGNNRPFQAVVRFLLNKYDPDTIPTSKVIRNMKIIGLERLAK